MCELLQLLYYSFSSLCNFDPICNVVIYFLLVLNFATVIRVLSINVILLKHKKTTTKKPSEYVDCECNFDHVSHVNHCIESAFNIRTRKQK